MRRRSGRSGCHSTIIYNWSITGLQLARDGLVIRLLRRREPLIQFGHRPTNLCYEVVRKPPEPDPVRVELTEVLDVQPKHPDFVSQSTLRVVGCIEVGEELPGAVMNELSAGHAPTERCILCCLQNQQMPDIVDLPGDGNVAAAFGRQVQELERLFDASLEILGTEVRQFCLQVEIHARFEEVLSKLATGRLHNALPSSIVNLLWH